MDLNTGKRSRPHEMIAGRRCRLLGFGGLDGRVLIRPGTDAGGERRGTDLVGLGAAPDLAGAIATGSSACWRRSLAAQHLEREVDARHRTLIAAPSGNAPVYGDPVAIAAE